MGPVDTMNPENVQLSTAVDVQTTVQRVRNGRMLGGRDGILTDFATSW